MNDRLPPCLILCFAGLLLASCAPQQSQPLELPSIISSNMVLQQRAEVTLWGRGTPGLPVRVEASWGASGESTVGSDGQWALAIATPLAGGPHRMTIAHADTLVELRNVLIGEVWVCSGQSNMEMPLAGWPPSEPIMGSEEAIASAHYPGIRLFTVPRAMASTPQEAAQGQWVECNPQTAAPFSATAFFFGRKLHRELGVPVGLIHSSWGGTPAESWVPREHLMAFEEFVPTLQAIDSALPKIMALNDWLAQLPALHPDPNSDRPWADLDLNDAQLRQADFDHSGWPTMHLPQLWERTEVGNFDGVVWFRRVIHLPQSWQGQELTLSLGPIDDMDATYFNGQRVGAHEQEGFWQTDRVYTIPGHLVQAGANLIAIRVIDHQGGGGIFGQPGALTLTVSADPQRSVPLAGPWAYLPVAEWVDGHFRLYHIGSMQFHQRPKLPIDFSSQTPTLLYNAMINPLVRFTIRGVIWYQGESNAGNPQQYNHLFPALIASWRDAWDQPAMPFYFVQIAPYQYGEATQSQRLREAQLNALRVPNTGMAVTLDIGSPNYIHPANKTDVGERLARWALAKDYGQDVVYSGPIYQSMEVVGHRIILTFAHAHGGLRAAEGGLRDFEIAGPNRVFYPASATILGSRLEVKSDRVKSPVAVRYAWSNAPEASLFNGVGLPASSFRTDQWD